MIPWETELDSAIEGAVGGRRINELKQTGKETVAEKQEKKQGKLLLLGERARPLLSEKETPEFLLFCSFAVALLSGGR